MDLVETDSENSDSSDDEIGRLAQPHHEVSEDQRGEEDDAEGEEVDMDVTQVVHGGIIRRASIPANTSMTSETSVIETDEGGEEKTMDFTIAIGGLLPHSPPVGAVSDRTSIGYSIPMSPNSTNRRLIPGQLMEGEVELEMDETGVFGGIIGADESLSSGSGAGEDTMRERTMVFSFGQEPATSDNMDMTTTAGGIIGMSQYPPVPDNRASHGEPSFARPTVSSAQKEKRNIFAPSPSPFKSTPKKSGMETASGVAKRLSFGSTTSSGGKKRTRVDQEMQNDTKRSRMGHVEEVFESTLINTGSPRKVAASPIRSLGTPLHAAKSPARSPALRRMLGEDVKSGAVHEQEWEQPPTIPLATFLEMAGVQFMEGLPGLSRRRSSVARGVLGQSYSGGGNFAFNTFDWMLTQIAEREFGLAEYAEAQIQSVFLNMYTWVRPENDRRGRLIFGKAAKKMKDDITSGQSDLTATESLYDLNNPPVIREYLSASDEDKQLFEMTFKAFKTNTQLKAKESWYVWKMELLGLVRPDIKEILGGMRSVSLTKIQRGICDGVHRTTRGSQL